MVYVVENDDIADCWEDLVKLIYSKGHFVNDERGSLTKELLEIKQFFGRIIEKAFHAVQHLLGRKKQEIGEMKEIDENYVLFEKQLDNINLEHGETIKNKNKDYTR